MIGNGIHPTFVELVADGILKVNKARFGWDGGKVQLTMNGVRSDGNGESDLRSDMSK